MCLKLTKAVLFNGVMLYVNNICTCRDANCCFWILSSCYMYDCCAVVYINVTTCTLYGHIVVML
jgi:hypothetical protein